MVPTMPACDVRYIVAGSWGVVQESEAEIWGVHPRSPKNIRPEHPRPRDVGHTLVMVPESTLRTKRRKLTGRIARVAAVALVVGSLGVQSGSAAEDPTYPGLPNFPVSGGWTGPRAVGINYVDKAKQWIRTPTVILGAFAEVVVQKDDFSCGRLAPYYHTEDYVAHAFFRSPRGSANPWGQIGPFKVRTVAFGSIPVEASVVINQPRDAQNLPVGLKIQQFAGTFCNKPDRDPPLVPPFPDIPNMLGGTNGTQKPAIVLGQVEVAVSALAVDGVALDLVGPCRTTEPGQVSLAGREYFSADPDTHLPGAELVPENVMTTPYFNLAVGGVLNGTIDVPAFTGCVTRTGEDVSRLLTATVSGNGNPVTMRSEGLVSNTCLEPNPPSGPGEKCAPFAGLPFPAAN